MEAVFIKALNMSVSAGWLILAVIVLRLLLKKAPKWISVVLWGIVGLRLVLPFSLQSVFSLIPSSEVVSPSIGYAQHPEINSGVSVIDNAVNPTLGTSLAATPMNSVNPMQIVLYMGGLVWVGGIAILLLYGLISYLRLRHKVAEAIPYEKNTWLCDQVKTPFILGVFRPRIYLPSGLNEEETSYVLAHEHAHLKRKDHLWKPLGFLLLTVYWFNPLVWVAYILLCRDIEAACDEKVISDMEMTEKKAYAHALVTCSMQRRLILACPLAFGEVGVKERVKGVLNYKKPAFWIIVAALIACVVIAVCFLTNPKDDGPDLSFLNYKNAIPLIGQNNTAPYANLYPADSDGVQPGVADAKALAQFLSGAEWTKRRAPSSSPEPRGYLELIIEDDYRIIVYQSERLAAVRFGNDIRYYRTGAGDYEAALATFIPAPSTEPDRPPEQTFDTELILSDPLSFLLSFSNAEIVTLIDNTGRSYEESGKSFNEIISSQTWTAQAIQGFTTVEPSRQIYLRGDDYWCLSFEQTAPDSEMTCCAHNLLSSQSMLISFDCGENLMDELMAWAIARQQESSAGIDLTDPEAILLSFSNAQVVTVIDETDRSYENTGRNFAEIVSAQTWSAEIVPGFPASIAERLIIMTSGDWRLRIEDDGEDCLYMACPNNTGANDPVIYLDCGKNLMDELMAWAQARQSQQGESDAQTNQAEEVSLMSLDGTVEYFFPSNSSFVVTNLPAVEVAPHEITAEEAARLANALFPGAAYSGYVFDAPRTKADLQSSMERWRGYVTDGTLSDLFCGDENTMADMEKVIGRWEEAFAEKLAAAPETETRIPAQWVFRPDSDAWAGGNPGTESIRALVDCGGVEYSFCAANRTQGDYSLHMIYGSLENKSSPNNIETLLQQYELCRSPRPTEAQLTVILEKAQSALTALNVGEWEIDLCLVERLPRGLEEAYIVTVKAVPVFQGNAAVRFAQLENMRSTTEGAQHYYYSDASFSFAPDGTLLDFSVYSLVDVVDVRSSGVTLGGDELLKVAKDRLAERGLAFYNSYYPTDLAISAKVYIDRMTYGLVRIEIEKGITYRYLPALCIDGHVELYDEYGKIFYESTTDGLTRMLVLNAVDGTDIVFSSYNSFTHIP